LLQVSRFHKNHPKDTAVITICFDRRFARSAYDRQTLPKPLMDTDRLRIRAAAQRCFLEARKNRIVQPKNVEEPAPEEEDKVYEENMPKDMNAMEEQVERKKKKKNIKQLTKHGVDDGNVIEDQEREKDEGEDDADINGEFYEVEDGEECQEEEEEDEQEEHDEEEEEEEIEEEEDVQEEEEEDDMEEDIEEDIEEIDVDDLEEEEVDEIDVDETDDAYGDEAEENDSDTERRSSKKHKRPSINKNTKKTKPVVPSRVKFARYEQRLRSIPSANFSCLDHSYLADFGLSTIIKKWQKQVERTGDGTFVHHAQVLAKVAKEHNIYIKGFTSENKKRGKYEPLPCGGKRESEGGNVRVTYVGKLRKNATGPSVLFCLQPNEEEKTK
jgi:hypothetical protein